MLRLGLAGIAGFVGYKFLKEYKRVKAENPYLENSSDILGQTISELSFKALDTLDSVEAKAEKLFEKIDSLLNDGKKPDLRDIIASNPQYAEILNKVLDEPKLNLKGENNV
ncbi:hypothetical protein CQA38_08245 [Campylobacter sp. MIT 12-5580]|uniref:hypothetical protein n=1 Tax=Campylobacter sp. MIT 12-5580 TaxID=2040651 RepID=UPI0010F9BD23|nr:hypothetical protein [Campylobacter sp. MIT 12-5580]TKX28350.1 hypothetical protein CQA38_08245 [Campylobacter sp. MIT 12-5580]